MVTATNTHPGGLNCMLQSAVTSPPAPTDILVIDTDTMVYTVPVGGLGAGSEAGVPGSGGGDECVPDVGTTGPGAAAGVAVTPGAAETSGAGEELSAPVARGAAGELPGSPAGRAAAPGGAGEDPPARTTPATASPTTTTTAAAALTGPMRRSPIDRQPAIFISPIRSEPAPGHAT
jgi:hypothetical protein